MRLLHVVPPFLDRRFGERLQDGRGATTGPLTGRERALPRHYRPLCRRKWPLCRAPQWVGHEMRALGRAHREGVVGSPAALAVARIRPPGKQLAVAPGGCLAPVPHCIARCGDDAMRLRRAGKRSSSQSRLRDRLVGVATCDASAICHCSSRGTARRAPTYCLRRLGVSRPWWPPATRS